MMNKLGFLQKIGGLLLLLLLFAACSQEESLPTGTLLPEGKYPLDLTAGVLEVAATPAKASTRATVDNDWQDVQSVAVQVDNEGVKEYSVTPSSNGSTANLTSTTPFYWKRSDETKQITAWHPYSTTYPTEWKVKADQSQKTGGYQASDLIKGSLSLFFADKDNVEKNKIAFAHQTAKLHIVLQAGKGISADELANATVSILNVANVDNGTTVTPCKIDGDFFALITGQEIAKGTQFIKVTVNGADFFYTPDKDTSFTGGNQYTYNITVNRTGLSVSVGETEKWNEGNTGEGSVSLPVEVKPTDGNQTFNLKDGDVYIIRGEGKGGFLFNIPERETATVILDEVKLVQGGTDQLGSIAIKIDGGGTVIFKLNSKENSINGYYSGIEGDWTDGHTAGNIRIEGPGTLNFTSDNMSKGISTANGKSIEIENVTIKMDYKYSEGQYPGAAIGCDSEEECGDITITNSDITITAALSYNDGTFFKGNWYGAAIGAGRKGTCGNITINGSTEKDFLQKIKVTNALCDNESLSDDKKVGKGQIGIKSGTVKYNP